MVRKRIKCVDVKSEPYDHITPPESIKLKKDVQVDHDDKKDVEEEEAEGFPKRWVIVVLCFSAFLLCNMDRVRPL